MNEKGSGSVEGVSVGKLEAEVEFGEYRDKRQKLRLDSLESTHLAIEQYKAKFFGKMSHPFFVCVTVILVSLLKWACIIGGIIFIVSYFVELPDFINVKDVQEAGKYFFASTGIYRTIGSFASVRLPVNKKPD